MQYLNKNNTVENHFLSFQRGEERGFNYFFEMNYKPLVHFAFSILKSKEAAEDAVEDCFVRLWEKRESIESASAVKPYLYTSVRNRCLDVLRKEGHSKVYEAHLKRATEEFAPDHVNSIITAESMFQVYMAVEKLPSKYKSVFEMFYLQGRELKDIASALDLPLATVKSRKKRTLELLRELLPHLGFLLLLFFKG